MKIRCVAFMLSVFILFCIGGSVVKAQDAKEPEQDQSAEIVLPKLGEQLTDA